MLYLEGNESGISQKAGKVSGNVLMCCWTKGTADDELRKEVLRGWRAEINAAKGA
jgi:hypothetical protein